jgi:hypothetical protein
MQICKRACDRKLLFESVLQILLNYLVTFHNFSGENFCSKNADSKIDLKLFQNKEN